MQHQEFFLQDEAYIRGNDLNHSFYVSKDTKEGKVTTSFRSIDDFLIWYDRQNTKHFHEKIINERVEYYDIDGKIEENDYWKNDKTTIINDFLQARKEWIDTTEYNNKELDVEKDLFILESTKLEIKKSFHIIIRNNFVFKNNLDQKKFINSFYDFLVKKNTGFVIDTSPYGQNQCFRTIDSSKLDDKHKKIFIRSDYNKLSMECDRRLFFPSWILPELQKASELSCISNENQLGKEYNMCYLNYVKDAQEKEEVIVPVIYNNEFSDEEAITLFDHISTERWKDYNQCLSLIFLAKDMGISYSDIHQYCKKVDNYSEKWVQDIINKEGKCGYTIGTLRYYLYQDVDKETFKVLFPKDKTFKEIMEVEPKDRTEKEQKFVDKIIRRMIQKNIKELTDTDGFIERKKEKFVQVRDINKDKIVVVKAGLGKGKTTATVNHINGYDYDCIIILTPRRSYAQTTISRVNNQISLPDDEKFVLYSDIKGAINKKYLVVQVESLHRFIHEFEGKDTLVILDEVESLLYQMTSHKTHGHNHIQNLDMFENLLNQSTKILCMDAFISNRTLNVLKNMNKKFSYYNYTKELEKRTAIEYPQKNILKNKLIKELEQNKKVYFFCSSRGKLTDYFLPDITSKFPNKKIIEYHSKKSSIDFNNINDEWSDADLVVVTCTVTVGCNYDVPNMFNSIFVYASACSRNLVRDIFQSCYRVRHIIDKKMYFCLDTRHNGINLPTNINEITEIINNKVKFHKSHYEKFLKMEFTNLTPRWVKELLINNIFESNMSIMNLKELFYKYLQLCNYEIEEDDKEELDDLDIDDEDSNLVFEDYQYPDIPDITFPQRQELLKKKKNLPLSDLEEFTLNKNFFQATLIVNGRSSLKMEDQISLWNVYCNYGKKKFRNLQYEKGLNSGTLRICDIISSSFPEIADNLSRKLEDIIDITQKLGLKNSQDFKIIDRNVIVDNLEWLEQNSERFHTNFGLRNRTKGEFTIEVGSKLLGKIFNSWGYSKIKKGKRKGKRNNGKQIDISDYCCENTEDIEIYEYLEPKSKKKIERKVRILKEGEDPLGDEE